MSMGDVGRGIATVSLSQQPLSEQVALPNPAGAGDQCQRVGGSAVEEVDRSWTRHRTGRPAVDGLHLCVLFSGDHAEPCQDREVTGSLTPSLMGPLGSVAR